MKFDGINNDPVGPQLMCAFQTLSYIDELKYISLKDDLRLDDNELLQILHRLLSLILFHHYIRKLSNNGYPTVTASIGTINSSKIC